MTPTATSLRLATLADLDAITQHPERCDNVIQLRSRTALRQMVDDGEIDPDVARAERRTDWGLRCDVMRFQADIRLGTKTRHDVAADFASRGMPVETAVRLLAKVRVPA